MTLSIQEIGCLKQEIEDAPAKPENDALKGALRCLRLDTEPCENNAC